MIWVIRNTNHINFILFFNFFALPCLAPESSPQLITGPWEYLVLRGLDLTKILGREQGKSGFPKEILGAVLPDERCSLLSLSEAGQRKHWTERRPGFPFWFCCGLTVWPWTSYLLTSLGLAVKWGGEVGCCLKDLPASTTLPLGGLSHLFSPSVFLCL